MLLDIGRRVQALCTTVSFDKPIISSVCVRVFVCASIIPDKKRPTLMSGVLGHFHGSLFPKLGFAQRKPSCLPSVPAPNEQGAWGASAAFLLSGNEVMDTGLEPRRRWGDGKP